MKKIENSTWECIPCLLHSHIIFKYLYTDIYNIPPGTLISLYRWWAVLIILRLGYIYYI